MVIFNELRITEDGKCLIVDCEVENVDIYANMYIKSIYLDYYKNTSSVITPSSKAYKLYENKNDDTSVKGKRVSFKSAMLKLTEFGATKLEDGLFFVFVECDGTLPADISNYPCKYDQKKDIGVILDWKAFYKRGMSYVASIYGICGGSNFCTNPDGFEDFIILWNALKLAIYTCDWMLVKDLWDKFLNVPYIASGIVTTSTRTSGGCGCGR